MKILLLSFLVLVAVSQAYRISNNDLHQWESYKVKYLKSYETKEEEVKRREIFVNNLKFIREHNAKYEAGTETFEVGVNKFTDMSSEEFTAFSSGYKRQPGTRKESSVDLTLNELEANTTVDWRTKGAVTAVKEQGTTCGSGWAFASTGALEGRTFIKKGTLTSLSEQQLIDCSGSYGNLGCSGGTTDSTYDYILTNKGIDTEASYPYTGLDNGTCKYDVKNKGATCTGYIILPEGNENKLKAAVYKVGPVAVGMDTSPKAFQHYKSGIFSSTKCTTDNLTHDVLAIGYGNSSGTAYWLLKNSYGTSWGLDGYFMLARDDNNMCGIASSAIYPTL